MSFEQMLILEFMSIVKWLLIGSGLVFIIGRCFRNGVDYLLKEVDDKKKEG